MVPDEPATGSILVIDDDDRIRESLAERLRMDGYRVLTAANGREALNLLKRTAHPALILLDVMMPVMDGWEFRAELLKDVQLASIPVIITSAIDSRYQIKGHLQAVEYFDKPFTDEQLLEAVRRYCLPPEGETSAE